MCEDSKDDIPTRSTSTKEYLQNGHAKRQKMTKPPSESWLVAVVACMLHILLASGIGTAGVLMVEFVDYFNSGKAEASWIGAVQLSVVGVGGLFLGGVVARFGCMKTVVLGALLSSGGLMIGSFTNSIPALCITLGVIQGAGLSCFIVSCFVSVQNYYIKRRSMATSIMTVGISLGVMVWPVWTEFLIRSFSWRGALQINAAINLHGIPFAMLLKIGLHSRDHMRGADIKQQQCRHSDTDVSNSLMPESQTTEVFEKTISVKQTFPDKESKEQLSDSNDTTKSAVSNSEISESVKLMSENSKSSNSIPEHYVSNVLMSNPETQDAFIHTSSKTVNGHVRTSPSLSQKQIQLETSPLQLSSDQYCNSNLEEVHDDEVFLPSLESTNKVSCTAKETKVKKCCVPLPCTKGIQRKIFGNRSQSSEKQKSPKRGCNFSIYSELLHMPEVILYILSTSFLNYGHVVTMTFMPAHAVHIKISKELAATAVSVVGFLGPVGRLGSGFLGDRFSKHRILLYTISGILTGSASILSAFAFNFACLVVYSVTFAILSGCYVTFMSTVLTDLVGIMRLPQALSLLLPCIGFLMLVSVITSGMLVDFVGSTAVAFVYGGSVQVVGGLLAFIAGRFHARRIKREESHPEAA